MFPYPYNNPFLQLNLDVNSAQPNSFPSQYLQKSDLSTRVPSVYMPDTQSTYNNLPSLLTKRTAPMDLNPAPTKFINHEGFPFPVEMTRGQDLSKTFQMQGKAADMDPYRLLSRSQPDIYGLPKGSSQQAARLNNGLQYSEYDLAQAEAQLYSGETAATQAYFRQVLESKGMAGQDFGAQLPLQGNDTMQKYLASLYGLQNGMQGGLGVQNLAGAVNLSSLSGLGGLAGLGNLGNLNNINNINNINNTLMMELVNQARNQQVLQQLAQTMGMPLMSGLQEVSKNEQNLRNLGLDLMLLNPTMAQNNYLNQMQQINMSQVIPQSVSPPAMNSKGTAQTLILQRPEPLRQESMIRKDSSHSGKGVALMQAPKEAKEDAKGRGVVLMNLDNNGRKENQEKLLRNKAEQEAREEKLMFREEKQQEKMGRSSEYRGKKMEIQNNNMLQTTMMKEPAATTNSREAEKIDKRQVRQNLQVEQQQIDRINAEKLQKKPVVQITQKPQRRLPNLDEDEMTKPYVEAQPVVRSKKPEQLSLNEMPAKVEKMIVEREEKKIQAAAPAKNIPSKVLVKEMNYLEAQKTQCTESDSDKGTSVSLGEEARGSLMSQLYLASTNTNLTLGETFYKTPEEKMEECNYVQKIVNTRVGANYQTVIPELMINEEDEEERKRSYKLAWDPQVANPKEITNYLKNLHRVLGAKVINQEKALRLLCKKNFDVEEVLATVKKNERYYSNFFGNSNCTRELRSRRNIE